MHYLLLGVDSLIACIAVSPLVSGRSRLALAALFGVADATVFMIGAGLGWNISATASTGLTTALLVASGLYLLLVAAGSRQIATWPAWIVPWALTLDNLTFGLTSDHQSAGSLLQQAGTQASSSALLALVGLLAAVAIPRMVPATRRFAANRMAGGALVFAAGLLLLVG
jgi:hypothetical protein